MKPAFSPTQVKSVKPIGDSIIVSDMAFDERISHGGIVLPNDDMKSSGIRPRWGKVYAIGPEQKDIKVGQYILISHGRWTRGAKIVIDDEEITIRRIDPENIIFVTDEEPTDDNISTAVHAEQLARA